MSIQAKKPDDRPLALSKIDDIQTKEDDATNYVPGNFDYYPTVYLRSNCLFFAMS